LLDLLKTLHFFLYYLKKFLNPYLQKDVYLAILQYGSLALKEILSHLINTSSEEEKVLLIDLLSETENVDAVTPLLGYARDDNEIVKREAISVLAKIDDERCIN